VYGFAYYSINSNKAERLASRKLQNAPLIHVLAQVRYAPVPEISKSIPVVQEALKASGFPRFEKSQIQSLVLNSGSMPRIDQVEKWDFLSRDKKTGVSLTQNFVLLHTSSYDTFATFGNMLRMVFETIAAAVTIELVERLGIRYVDLVRLEDGQHFEEFLTPGLMGFPFRELSANVVHSVSVIQSVGELEDSSLIVRFYQTADGTFLPPDLNPPVLNYDVKLKPGEVVGILDSDSFKIVDLDFSPNDLIATFDELHKIASEVFRRATTDFAVKKWS